MWMVQRFRLSRLGEGVYFLTTLIYLLSLLTGGAYTPWYYILVVRVYYALFVSTPRYYILKPRLLVVTNAEVL